MSNITLGLVLMLVGMVTVFLILLIVIWGSRGVIVLVNRLAPESTAARQEEQGVDPLTRKILEEAVASITGGQGSITNITTL